MSATESQIQRQVMHWWRMQYKVLGAPDYRLLMAYPLQGARTPRNGARMKAEGMRKGTPDMFLAIPQGQYLGMWIELKKEGGRLSEDQKEMLNLLAVQGYATPVCYGFEATLWAIRKYMGAG
jgi:hypothetical protein